MTNLEHETDRLVEALKQLNEDIKDFNTVLREEISNDIRRTTESKRKH